MDTLWAPWRMEYILGAKDASCIFCSKPRAANRRDALVLAVTKHSVVMLNRFPYANGHLMVAPLRHTADFAALDREEAADLDTALRRTVGLLQEALHPQGMNVGMNLGECAGAGFKEHLHWHVVPRWIGDTNFMPLLAEVRVMPEHMEALYERLLPYFEHF